MQQPAALSAILSMLACPVCHGSLHLNEEKLICESCNRIYPIVDGIPILIADKAKSPEK